MAMNKTSEKTPLTGYFNIDNSKTTDKIQIANAFNKYFTNIGKNISDGVFPANTHYSNFLNRQHDNSMFFDPITPVELRKIS